MEVLRKLGVEIVFSGNGQQQLSNIDGAIGKMTNSVKNFAKIAAGAFAFNYAKNFIKEGIQLGDSLHDQAERVGIATEELQKWTTTAQLAGVESASLAKGIGFFNSALGKAQTGNTAAIKTFQQLGFTPEQIKNIKNASELLYIFADRLAALPTDAQRVAYTSILFGRGGKELALILGKGSKALKEQHAEFEKLGIIIDKGTIKSIDGLGDRLELTGKQWDAFKIKAALAAQPLLEMVNQLLSKFLEFSKNSETVKDVVYALGAAFATAGLIAITPWLPVLALGTGLFLIFNDLYHFIKGDMNTALEMFIKNLFGIEKGEKAVGKIRGAFQAFLSVLTDISQVFQNIKDTFKFAGRVFAPARGQTMIATEMSQSKVGPRKDLQLAASLNGLGFTMPVPQDVQYSTPISGAQTVNQTNHININGNDTVAMKKALDDHLNQTINSTKEDFVRKAQ